MRPDACFFSGAGRAVRLRKGAFSPFMANSGPRSGYRSMLLQISYIILSLRSRPVRICLRPRARLLTFEHLPHKILQISGLLESLFSLDFSGASNNKHSPRVFVCAHCTISASDLAGRLATTNSPISRQRSSGRDPHETSLR